MAEPIGYTTLPETVDLGGGLIVPVKWARLSYYEYKPAKEDKMAAAIAAISRGETYTPKPQQEAETRDIFAPVLPPEYSSLQTYDILYKSNLYSQSQDGLFYQMGKQDIAGAEAQKQIDLSSFTKVVAYYSMVAKALDAGIIGPNDEIANPGIRKALATYASSLAGGGIYDTAWMNKIKSVKELVPGADMYTQLGASNLNIVPEWNRQMTTTPAAMRLRDIDERLAMDILSKTPEEIEKSRRFAEGERLRVFEETGLNDVALNYLRTLPEDMRTQGYGRVLGKITTGEMQNPQAGYTMPTQQGINQYLANPQNVPYFERALSVSQARAREDAPKLYPTANQAWATLKLTNQYLEKTLNEQLWADYGKTQEGEPPPQVALNLGDQDNEPRDVTVTYDTRTPREIAMQEQQRVAEEQKKRAQEAWKLLADRAREASMRPQRKAVL